MRKYPAVTDLSREAAADYKVDGTNYTIKKGTKVFIPVYAVHNDPEYYPNPEKFDPESFTSFEVQKRNPMLLLVMALCQLLLHL